ncbi:MAG: ribbon-helix-helix domain-containing protein [Candidatus Margulisbacteria bacterium]|jgi:predicted transcriptional regulator|nr:ribbon-helix-helix domain-containing protein [Candidatus Margulisiibacteriota bacterium]
MATVRLPQEIEHKLAVVSRTKHKSKSDLIREALDIFFYREESALDSYELGKAYFGRYGSGRGELSREYKEILKRKLHAKQCAY